MKTLKVSETLLKHSKPSIFQLMSKMAIDNNALNFGQGFPNWTVPDIIYNSLQNQIGKNDLNNTYYSFGSRYLLDTLQNDYSKLLNRKLEWDRNIITGAGATAILGYIFMQSKPGDEMIAMEPYFPWYQVPLELFKGKVRFVRLKEQPNHTLSVDFDEIAALCNNNTRYIIVNSPHNPTGKLFTEQHFEALKRITDKFKNITILSDEVYERVVFNGEYFKRLATYNSLWDRTISIYSGGKTYSCTGWRIGWAIGPETLISPLKEIQRITNNQTHGLLMDTIAQSIEDSEKPYKGEKSYYEYLDRLFNRNKELLVAALRKSHLNFDIIEPEGGHFVVVGIQESITHMPVKYFFKEGTSSENTPLPKFDDWRELKGIEYKPDEAFCAFLTKEYRITPIPCSAFYLRSSNENENDDEVYMYIRFAICKRTEDIMLLDKYLTNRVKVNTQQACHE